MMPNYDVQLVAKLKQMEIEDKAKDAWMYFQPKKKRNFWGFLKNKPLAPACECNCLSEA